MIRALALALGLGLAACRSQRAAPEPAAARLALDATGFDFGPATTHDRLTHAFEVRNAGRAPLTLSMEAGHECTSTTPALSLPAGAKAALDVSCRPEHHGSFLSTLAVSSNDPEKQRVVLELSAQVTPLLAWDRPLLAFSLPFGAEQREALHLIGKRAQDAKLSPILPLDAPLSLELQPAPGSDLAVTAHGTRVGLHTGELKIRTGLDDPSELDLPFSCRVIGTLEVEPSNPYFDLLVPGGQQVVLTVRSSQANFRLLAAEVIDGPFSASVSGHPGAPYRVELSFLAARAPDAAHGASGHVRLRSTDRSEPERTLDLFALGHSAPVAATTTLP